MTAAVLLDTHAFIWWLEGGGKLSATARAVIRNPGTTVLISAASAWEISIKEHMGKFRVPDLLKGFKDKVHQEGFVELPISIEHAIRAGSLPASHKDPFDRMLSAQSELEQVPIVSRDPWFRKYAVKCLW